jgi:hypothetical protein
MSMLFIASSVTAAPPARHPIHEVVAVHGATVNAVVVDGAEPGQDDEWLRQLLIGQATATGRRAAIEQKLCRIVEPDGGGYRLTIEVDMPIALPSDITGSTAAFRKGVLAVARLQLSDEQGAAIATAEASVRWGQVRWTTGSHKNRRQRPREAALIDAAEASVYRGVRQLVRTLSRDK